VEQQVESVERNEIVFELQEVPGPAFALKQLADTVRESAGPPGLHPGNQLAPPRQLRHRTTLHLVSQEPIHAGTNPIGLHALMDKPHHLEADVLARRDNERFGQCGG